MIVDYLIQSDSGLQVGDGTTTVVLLAGEFLKEAKPFVEDRVHPQNLIRSYRTASYLVMFWIFSFLCRVEMLDLILLPLESH